MIINEDVIVSLKLNKCPFQKSIKLIFKNRDGDIEEILPNLIFNIHMINNFQVYNTLK